MKHAIAFIAFVIGLYAVGAVIDGPTEYDAAQRTAAASRDIERIGLAAATKD